MGQANMEHLTFYTFFVAELRQTLRSDPSLPPFLPPSTLTLPCGCETAINGGDNTLLLHQHTIVNITTAGRRASGEETSVLCLTWPGILQKHKARLKRNGIFRETAEEFS